MESGVSGYVRDSEPMVMDWRAKRSWEIGRRLVGGDHGVSREEPIFTEEQCRGLDVDGTLSMNMRLNSSPLSGGNSDSKTYTKFHVKRVST